MKRKKGSIRFYNHIHFSVASITLHFPQDIIAEELIYFSIFPTSLQTLQGKNGISPIFGDGLALKEHMTCIC